MKTELDKNEKRSTEQEAPPIANVLLAADWIPISESLPKKGVNVRCKMKDIGLGKVEKTLYRMKHNGKWNDYNSYVTHWKPI
jgi:hypothetical protein